jgi:hypothetical protein
MKASPTCDSTLTRRSFIIRACATLASLPLIPLASSITPTAPPAYEHAEISLGFEVSHELIDEGFGLIPTKTEGEPIYYD